MGHHHHLPPLPHPFSLYLYLPGFLNGSKKPPLNTPTMTPQSSIPLVCLTQAEALEQGPSQAGPWARAEPGSLIVCCIFSSTVTSCRPSCPSGVKCRILLKDKMGYPSGSAHGILSPAPASARCMLNTLSQLSLQAGELPTFTRHFPMALPANK